MGIRRQGLTLFTAVCWLIAPLLVIQLWLLSAAIDAFLSDEVNVLAPAAAASAGLFLLCSALLFYAIKFDHRMRKSGG
jgi:hypothetical protein